MRSHLSVLLLLALGPTVQALANDEQPRAPAQRDLIATRGTSFPDIARAGASRLAECTIPRALPFGAPRD